MIGSLVRRRASRPGSWSPTRPARPSTGVVDADGRPAAEADRAGGARLPARAGAAADRPGLLAARAPHPALSRTGTRPPPLFAGWLPRGFISTEPLKDIIRRVVPDGWSDRTRASGSSPATTPPAAASPFGRADAPAADLADAVAASCAIPGFYHPVEIGGRRYVDGGMYSTSNLDLLRDRGLDLVICLNPTSSLHPTRRLEPGRVARPG